MTDETLVATHARVIADVVAEHGGGAQLMLEQAQAGPLARLHHRSDDFDVWSWRPARQFLESYPGSPRKRRWPGGTSRRTRRLPRLDADRE